MPDAGHFDLEDVCSPTSWTSDDGQSGPIAWAGTTQGTAARVRPQSPGVRYGSGHVLTIEAGEIIDIQDDTDQLQGCVLSPLCAGDAPEQPQSQATTD